MISNREYFIIIIFFFIIDGHSFFESLSRNFIYFLFKLPTQHTVTDILDIWVKSLIIQI
jgi:hypothetical protein